MKFLIVASFLGAAALTAGCVSPQHVRVLDPIGPPNSQSTDGGLNGTVVAFSTFDPEMSKNSRQAPF
jgi:hypothetical protein